MNLFFIFTVKTFWMLVMFSYLAVISRRWQASRKRMWFPPYNTWTWLTTTRDSTSSPYLTNRSTPRTRPWRNAKYESTPSVCTGNPRTGASGASGERSQDLGGNMYARGGEKFVKLEVIMNELVAHDKLQAKWFGVWGGYCSSIAWLESQYQANNEIIYMVYLFLWCLLVCRDKGTQLYLHMQWQFATAQDSWYMYMYWKWSFLGGLYKFRISTLCRNTGSSQELFDEIM